MQLKKRITIIEKIEFLSTNANKNWTKFGQIETRTTRKWHSESADPAKALDLSLAKQTNRQSKFFGHTEVRTLNPWVFSAILLPTEL